MSPSLRVNTPRLARRSLVARSVTVALGAWLVLSAFAWPHTPSAFHNTWIVGLLVFLTGLWALRDPFARWVTGFAGLWLTVSTFFMWQLSTQTFWHNLAIGLVATGLAFVTDGTPDLLDPHPVGRR